MIQLQTARKFALPTIKFGKILEAGKIFVSFYVLMIVTTIEDLFPGDKFGETFTGGKNTQTFSAS